MKVLYKKLSADQKRTLSANTIHWKRKNVPKSGKNAESKKRIRTLFYKPNIMDY